MFLATLVLLFMIGWLIVIYWPEILLLILAGLALWALYAVAVSINWPAVLLFLHITFWVIIFVAVCGLVWRGLLCED